MQMSDISVDLVHSECENGDWLDLEYTLQANDR